MTFSLVNKNKMLLFRRFLSCKVAPQAALKAKEKFLSVLPLFDLERDDPEFEARVKRSAQLRGLDLDYEALKLQKNLCTEMSTRLEALSKRRKELQLAYDKTTEERLKNQLTEQSRQVRDDYRRLKSSFTVAKNDLIHKTLYLPNDIHPATPTTSEGREIFAWTGDLEAKQGSVVPPAFPSCTYFTGRLAEIDLFLPLYSLNVFHEAGFVQTSNPDFIKRIVTKSLALKPDAYCTISEEHEAETSDADHWQHFVGGGSTAAFSAFFAHLSVYPSTLPLKLVTCSTQYNAHRATEGGELQASQATVLEIFAVAKDREEANEVLEAIRTTYVRLYQRIGHSFRMVDVPAKDLALSESRRIEIRMRRATGEELDVASIRCHEDYLSQRLMFNWKTQEKTHRLPFVLTGTAMHIPKLLQTIDLDEFDVEKLSPFAE